MCHSDASYRHPFRTVMRAVLVLAVVVPGVLSLHVPTLGVLAVLGLLVVVAGVAKMADVIGTRRAVREHEARCAALARERMRLRLEATAVPAPRTATIDAHRPAALGSGPPPVDPAWLAEPDPVRVARKP